MSEVVREFGVYYDTDPFRVSGHLVDRLAEQAATFVGRFAGPIAVKSSRGFKLPPQKTSIDPEFVTVGAEPHALLFTKRAVLPGIGSTQCSYSLLDANGVATSSRSVTRVHELDFTGMVAVADTSRSIGQTLGVRPCGNLCVMTNSIAIMTPQPICNPCAEGLARGGQAALAAQA